MLKELNLDVNFPHNPNDIEKERVQNEIALLPTTYLVRRVCPSVHREGVP